MLEDGALFRIVDCGLRYARFHPMERFYGYRRTDSSYFLPFTPQIKRQNCTSRSADLVVPGSKAHWKLFAQECRPRVHHNEDYSSEKVRTKKAFEESDRANLF